MLGLLLPDGRLMSRNMHGITGLCGRIMMFFLCLIKLGAHICLR